MLVILGILMYKSFLLLNLFPSWTLADDYITWNAPQDHPLGSIDDAEENGDIYYWDEAAYDSGGQGWTRAADGVEIPQPAELGGVIRWKQFIGLS